jgi:hypothetical protein
VHATGFAPVQTPAWHVSVRVQAFWSSQVTPFATFENAVVLFVGWHV